MKYQHCIFDLYGTLVDIHTDEEAPALWEGLAEYYARRGAVCSPEELRTSFRRLMAEADAALLRQDACEGYPEIQMELVFQQMFREKGVNADMEEAVRAGLRFRALSTEYVRLYDGAAELLKNLRAHGCGVWLLSNAQHIFTMWELEKLGLSDCFDGIYLSSDYGVKKPDRRFFERLLRERDIPVGRAVMIGNDGVCDIQGGRAVGLHTLYIHSNLSPDEPEPAADDVLHEMDLRRVWDNLRV